MCVCVCVCPQGGKGDLGFPGLPGPAGYFGQNGERVRGPMLRHIILKQKLKTKPFIRPLNIFSGYINPHEDEENTNL